MWKLFITLLAVSDTGSISTNIMATDYNDFATCKQAAAQATLSPEVTRHIGNHEVTMRAEAFCKPAGTVADAPAMNIPPPIVGALRGALGAMVGPPPGYYGNRY